VDLGVLHLGLSDEAVLAKIVEIAFLPGDLLSSYFLLLPGLVVLHRCSPNETILAQVIEVTRLSFDLLFSNLDSHKFTLMLIFWDIEVIAASAFKPFGKKAFVARRILRPRRQNY